MQTKLCRKIESIVCDVENKPGYHLVDEDIDGFCEPNICKCSNGLPANSEDCEEHNSKKCKECDNFFHLDEDETECILNECKCDKGVAVSNHKCLVHQTQSCIKCDGNYHLQTANVSNGKFSQSPQTCEKNKCVCPNGRPEAEKCLIHGQQHCKECDKYYHLEVDDYGFIIMVE